MFALALFEICFGNTIAAGGSNFLLHFCPYPFADKKWHPPQHFLGLTIPGNFHKYTSSCKPVGNSGGILINRIVDDNEQRANGYGEPTEMLD
jgi:hypothetical protein